MSICGYGESIPRPHRQTGLENQLCFFMERQNLRLQYSGGNIIKIKPFICWEERIKCAEKRSLY